MPMLVTTTFGFEGYRIREYKGIVRGIIVRSPTIAQGIFGGLQNILGGSIGAYTEMCEQARQDRVLEDVGEIAGVKDVAIVHRIGPIRARSTDRRDGDRRRMTGVARHLGAIGETAEVLGYADAHVDEFAVAAVDRHVVGAQIGVGGDEGLRQIARRER